MFALISNLDALDLIIGVMSLLIGLGGYALAINFYLRRPLKKGVTCTLSKPILVNVPSEEVKGIAQEHFATIFRGNEIGQFSVIYATIRNVGHEPVHENEIERPISFVFPEGTRVVDSEIIDRSVGVEEVPVEEQGGGHPCTKWRFRSLSHEEYFTLQFLIEGRLKAMPIVSARIPGMQLRTIHEVPSAPVSRRMVLLGMVSGATIGTIFVAVGGGLGILRTSRIVDELESRVVRRIGVWPFAGEPGEGVQIAATTAEGEQLRLNVSSGSRKTDEGTWEYTYLIDNVGRETARFVRWEAAGINRQAISPASRLVVVMHSMAPPRTVSTKIEWGRNRYTNVETVVPGE